MKILALLFLLQLFLVGCGITNIPEGGSPAQPRGLMAGNFMPSCWIFCTITNELVNTESGMSGSVTGGAVSNTQTQSLKLGGGGKTSPTAAAVEAVVPVVTE